MPGSKSQPTANDRLEARIPRELKALLVRAAALQGQSLTDFVVSAATTSARQIIADDALIVLTERDQLAFAEALSAPAPEPTERMREAARRFSADLR